MVVQEMLHHWRVLWKDKHSNRLNRRPLLLPLLPGIVVIDPVVVVLVLEVATILVRNP